VRSPAARIAHSVEFAVAALRARAGQPLKGSELGELWKCRVGDPRVITAIEEPVLRVLEVRAVN